MFHAVGDRKGLRQVSIESDLAVLVLMQLDHHLWTIWRTAMSLLDER